MFLANNSTYPVGLDISDLSIKLVQLNKVRDKIKIQALSRLTLAEGIITNGEIKNKPELIKAIQKIMSSPDYGKVSSEEVIACLPESKTFVKLIEVQKSPNTLADVIGAEIEKHVPLVMNDSYFDWQIIEELPDKYFVLIGAAPKEIVNQYTELLDKARLTPVALEIEPIAFCRCLLKEEAIKDQKVNFGLKTNPPAGLNYGIIDIGANHTCMIFYSGNTILFTVSMPISGEEITLKISQALNLTKEQAEKAKIICGLEKIKANGIIKDILADTTKNLITKIKEAIAFYENYFGQRGPLNQILLCGGGANIADLPKLMTEELKLDVKLADALINLDDSREKFGQIFRKKYSLDAKNSHGEKDKKSGFEQDTSVTFATAFGLALRGIFVDEL